MKTIAISSQKGGSGKSTVTIHLAVAAANSGMDVLVADLDPHSQTAAEWASERELDTPLVVKANTQDIVQLTAQAKEEGFDLLIFDCPPYVDDVVKVATEVADYTLIPAQPRFADIRTLPRVIDNVAPPFAVVLNACQVGLNGQESSKTREARMLLEEAGIFVAPLHITRREAFADALNGGTAVYEFEPGGKAAKEIDRLWSWLQEVWNG